MARDDTTSDYARTSCSTREKVLECASQLLDEGGPDAVTIRKVAALSGLTPPAIYELFGDKARLIDALVLHSVERVLEQVGRPESSEDARDYMRRGFRQLVAFGREHPWHFQLAERLPLRMILGEAAREKLNEPLALWAGADPVAAEEIRLIRQVFWVMIHGLITLPLARPNEVWHEDLVEVCFEAMSAGILATRSASKL